MEYRIVLTFLFVIQYGNGQVTDTTTTTQNSATSASAATVTSTPANTPSTTVATTLSPTCVQGTCTDQDVDDDYKCLAKINGTCPKTGGCETEVTKTTNTTQIVVSCVSSCPTVTTTTTSSKIITCCLENMCNQYQPPFSKAHCHSPNVMYYVGALLFITRQMF